MVTILRVFLSAKVNYVGVNQYSGGTKSVWFMSGLDPCGYMLVGLHIRYQVFLKCVHRPALWLHNNRIWISSKIHMASPSANGNEHRIQETVILSMQRLCCVLQHFLSLCRSNFNCRCRRHHWPPDFEGGGCPKPWA